MPSTQGEAPVVIRSEELLTIENHARRQLDTPLEVVSSHAVFDGSKMDVARRAEGVDVSSARWIVVELCTLLAELLTCDADKHFDW